MKKFRLSAVCALCLCLLAACAASPADSGSSPQPAGAPAPAEGEAPAVLTLRVVDGAEEGDLLLAGEGAGEVYTLPVGEIPVRLGGGTEEAGAGVLEDGMVVDVACSGTVLETFPAQLGAVSSITAWPQGTEKNPGGAYYDLCGLYLQVLEDLWAVDPGLNSDDGLTSIGVDLSRAPGGLTEGEKAAVAWRFAESHGKALVTGAYEELLEQGYITAEPLEGSDAKFMHWEDGVLFSITPADGHEDEAYSLPVLFFNAEKWRSSLGAYGFSDCSALWPELGTWTGYTAGSEYIS
nr:hypothetical protein [uncultured Dysosmobacter sp.]